MEKYFINKILEMDCDDNGKLNVRFVLEGDEENTYRELETNRDKIDNEISCDLEWMFLEGRKASRIKTVTDADVSQSNKWEEYFSWMLEKSEEFQRVFSKYV